MSATRKYVMMPYEMVDKVNDEEQNSNNFELRTKAPSEKEVMKEEKVIQERTEDIKTNKSTNFIKERVRLRLENILKIVTKVALINGYDGQRRIKGRNGKYINNTDIAELIIHAMQPAKVVRGEDEFVHLLHEARVEPEWLFNENLKAKLLPKNSAFVSDDEIKQPTIEQHMFVEKPQPLVNKRKRNEEEEENEISSKKRKIDWEYPNDE